MARALVLPLATLFRSRGDFSLTPVGFFIRLLKKIKVSAFFQGGFYPSTRVFLPGSKGDFTLVLGYFYPKSPLLKLPG